MAQSLKLPNGTARVVEDVPDAFAQAVVGAFASRSEERFRLVLSGGPTARRCYEALAAQTTAAANSERPVDWQVVDVLMGDERCVAPADPEANQRLVREALLTRVEPVGSFHPMDCGEPSAYQRLLEGMPVLDLVHLGLGPDGHTASLFTASAALDAPEGTLAMLSRDPNERNPHDRMTITLETIARARLVLFTVEGSSKAQAFNALRNGDDIPASRVRAREVVVLVDPEAAGETAGIA